jgi:prophage regulatory protein
VTNARLQNQGEVPEIALIKIGKVCEITSFSRGQIYDLMRAGKFPANIKLGGYRAAWLRHEVVEWLDHQIKNCRENGSDNSHLSIPRTGRSADALNRKPSAPAISTAPKRKPDLHDDDQSGLAG